MEKVELGQRIYHLAEVIADLAVQEEGNHYPDATRRREGELAVHLRVLEKARCCLFVIIKKTYFVSGQKSHVSEECLAYCLGHEHFGEILISIAVSEGGAARKVIKTETKEGWSPDKLDSTGIPVSRYQCRLYKDYRLPEEQTIALCAEIGLDFKKLKSPSRP